MKTNLSPTELLFLAVKNSDNPKSINKLIEEGEDIEAQEENGYTSLHIAAREGYLNTVNVLINALKAKGANIDTVNKWGNTALIVAAQEDHVDVVNALMAAGANKEAVDNWGNTALMTAAQYGHIDVAEALMAAGANIDAFNKDGNTALMLAAQDGQFQDDPGTVIAFIKNGADILVENRLGQTVLQSLPQYFNKQFLLPIFKDAIDEGNIKVLVNLCKYAHYRTELSRIDPNDTPENSAIVAEFNIFLGEYDSIAENLGKEVGLVRILGEKLTVIANTAASNSQSIDKMMLFLTNNKKEIYIKTLNIVGISELIMSYVGWQKWQPKLILEETLQAGQTYQSIDNITKLLKAYGTDVTVVLNKNPDTLQEVFGFSRGENAVSSSKIYETSSGQRLISKTIKQPAQSNLLTNNEAQEPKVEEANKANSYSNMIYKATMALKALDIAVDAFKVTQEPTFENFKGLASGAIHLGVLITGTGGYLPLVSDASFLAQDYQGEFMQAGITAGYMLLPTMLGTSLAPVYATAVLTYSLCVVANNAYSVYSNYGTPESQLKSDLAYAELYNYVGLQDRSKACLVNAMQIAREDSANNHDESSIQHIAAEYDLLGKFCMLEPGYDYCNV